MASALLSRNRNELYYHNQPHVKHRGYVPPPVNVDEVNLLRGPLLFSPTVYVESYNSSAFAKAATNMADRPMNVNPVLVNSSIIDINSHPEKHPAI